MWCWSDITSAEWDKNIYFEKIQTIDNIQILNDMTKKDWFRWDFLIMHDLVRLKRHEFEKLFVEYREEKIFYVFLDLLFRLIENEESLINIVDFLQMNYSLP